MTNEQRIAAVRRARRHLHAATGYKPSGGHYKAVDEELDALERSFRREQKPKPPKSSWTNVGPVQPGGKSLLDMSLTHDTSGIPLFPAVDTNWGNHGGVQVIAPEDCIVDTKDTHASPGEALYLTGASGLRYWMGHITVDYPLGRVVHKGDAIARTVDQSPGADHLHIGVNAEKLLGKGRQLKYGRTGNGPDYTTGSPTIRAQLLQLDL